ncbi:hypothetical protein [Halomicrobium salinisoli]|uniref:hypothetical protein n=1 Tax=Halomicrobium salinisoli TaxID=2878391 RepID=UPI001CF0C7EE|nr:hypothetical protein [Halomicrobium salinisoli]
MAGDRNRVRVECTECPFVEVIEPDDERRPADVIIDHGSETGHIVVPRPAEE